MVRWLSGQPAPSRKFHVKVKPSKLQGFRKEKPEDGRERIVAVRLKWKGPRSGLVPFYRSSRRRQRDYTRERLLVGGSQSVGWDDEFESMCNFWIVGSDNSFGSWDLSFHVLCGESSESRTKLAVVGKASCDLAELASKMASQVETSLPVTLQIDGVTIQASLLVHVSFAEVRNSHDYPQIVPMSTDSDKPESLLKMVKSLTGYKTKKKGHVDQMSSCDSDESAVFDSDGSPRNGPVAIAYKSSDTELGTPSSSETRLGLVKRVGSISWKKPLNFRPSKKKKGNPLIAINDEVDTKVDQQLNSCSIIDSVQKHTVREADAFDPTNTSQWERKELVSRDGHAKVNANVLFASFDQRSDKADGESACTALVTVIAHWLHSNQDVMPTRSQFDSLITQGSSEWRKLCGNDAYMNAFPNKHFDIETVLEADLRPLSVLHDKSFTGFFSPEKFESLKEAMSFDQIWNEINSITTQDCDPKIYIVSWNDHFFVLKVEANVYYIIDSLGERLFEGCNQAYILKFDDSTSMYAKAAKTEAENTNNEESKRMICKGKECCKEYIKRFLAAIPLEELEAEEKKGSLSTLCLLRRLQIDFHYCSALEHRL